MLISLDGWMDPCRFVISIMTSDSLWLELLQIHLICYSTVLLPKTKRQQTWLSLPSCWLLSESWHKTWIINAQSRCYEALHNVFTRFQSGPPFYFFMTVVWHWSLAPFILCSRFRHFYYSHPWWGYMIPLASNIGRPHEVPETSCLCARDSKPLLNLIHGSASTAPTMTPSLHYFE